MRAIGMVEFNSIAKGIYAADQMAKISEVEFAAATSTCPGKYIAIVHGDVAAVEDSVRIGERMAGEFFIDSIMILAFSRRSPAQQCRSACRPWASWNPSRWRR